jgi:hypothetical protein
MCAEPGCENGEGDGGRRGWGGGGCLEEGKGPGDDAAGGEGREGVC